MCLDPVSMGVLSAGIGLMKTVATFGAQQEESRKNAENAMAANAIEQRQLTLRQIQENQAAAQKKQAQNIQEAEVLAEAKVSQASMGVAGASVDNILADVSRKAATNRETIAENTRMTVQQLQTDKTASTIKAKSRIDSMPPPNPLSLVAGIGSAALTGYNTYEKYMG